MTKRPRMCVDRVVPFEYAEEAERIAIARNPANAPAANGRIAVDERKRWDAGSTLAIRFLDGSTTQQDAVVRHADAWTRHANIRFDFGDHADADLRISFAFDKGSAWSALGTDALVQRAFPLAEPTMNLGWLEDDTPDDEYARVVLHEFGHALGCIHEHQTPIDGPRWNREAVYAHFGGPPNNWSRDDVDVQILDKYAAARIRGTTFDPDSIMLYAFPAELLENGVATHENLALSDEDKRFIGLMYP